MLYIFWFLHQTTTLAAIYDDDARCISFDSYIKPQPRVKNPRTISRCISFDSYIKPQLLASARLAAACCISFESYIKPQLSSLVNMARIVVYLLNPTSNHNVYAKHLYMLALYIFWFLHQTTTLGIGSFGGSMLYIFWILHQTTTAARWWSRSTGCISFESYIKPQRNSLRTLSEARCISFESYIKPQLIDHVAEAESSCISFESYIKPQPRSAFALSRTVVYLLNPTSNHNILQELS